MSKSKSNSNYTSSYTKWAGYIVILPNLSSRARHSFMRRMSRQYCKSHREQLTAKNTSASYKRFYRELSFIDLTSDTRWCVKKGLDAETEEQLPEKVALISYSAS